MEIVSIPQAYALLIGASEGVEPFADVGHAVPGTNEGGIVAMFGRLLQVCSVT